MCRTLFKKKCKEHVKKCAQEQKYRKEIMQVYLKLFVKTCNNNK